MGKPAVLAIKVIADAKQAQAELDSAGGAVKKTGDKLGKMALPAGIALGAITAFGKSAVSAASDVEQSFGGLEAVFGKNADQAKDLAKNSAKSTGLATDEYATMAAAIGSQLKAMGTAQDQLVPSTKNLVAMGADLAATYGGTTADAVTAVSSLLRGETEPIRKYGVSISAAAVQAEVLAKGLDTSTTAAKTQANAQATLALLTKQTTDAHGQFEAQLTTTGEQQQVAAAEMKNATAAIGKGLLPAVTAVTKVFAGMAAWVGENAKVATVLIAVVGGLAAAILVANAAIKAVTAVTRIWSAVQAAFNIIMSANPILLVVLGIAALVAGIIIAYNKVGWFKAFVDASFKAILSIVQSVAKWIQTYLGPLFEVGFKAAGDAAQTMLRIIKGVMDGITAAVRIVTGVISTIADAIKNVIDLIGKIHIPKLPNLNPFSRSAPVPASVGAGNTAGLRRAGAARGGAASITVNVSGALDPDAVARQIRTILARADIRNGSRVGVTRGWASGLTT